jgi:hypothetical protein
VETKVIFTDRGPWIVSGVPAEFSSKVLKLAETDTSAFAETEIPVRKADG